MYQNMDNYSYQYIGKINKFTLIRKYEDFLTRVNNELVFF